MPETPPGTPPRTPPLDGTPRGRWVPLLDGREAEPYLEIIGDIAGSLLAPPSAWIAQETRPSEKTQRDPARSASLAGGLSGISLFYAYLHLVQHRGEDAQQAVRHLNEAMDLVEKSPMPPSLYGGFTGVAWTIAHLQERIQDEDDDDGDALGEIDDVLLEYLQQPVAPGNYDIVSGLVGQGVYALERLPRPKAAACLEHIVRHLADTATVRDSGITWLTPPGLLPPQQREEAPRGTYNLGVAHGLPGIIALLGAVCRAGVAGDRALELLEGAVGWLLAHRLPPGAGACFPYWLDPDPAQRNPRPARQAWCYGDPGIAATLLGAARCVARQDWEKAAMDIARTAAAKGVAESGVVDAGFCHGAAGLAHIYNRIWQATGAGDLAEAARRWYQQTLDLRRPGVDVAGFPAFKPLEDESDSWVADAGLLTGAAGIALALLAGVSAVDPAWDRTLLVCIPSNPDDGVASRSL
jgi:lantibiotic modifying enzyme